MGTYSKWYGKIDIVPDLNEIEIEFINNFYDLEIFRDYNDLNEEKYLLEIRKIFPNATSENVKKIRTILKKGWNSFSISDNGNKFYIAEEGKHYYVDKNLYNFCQIIFSENNILKTLFPKDTKFLNKHSLNGQIVGIIEGNFEGYIIENNVIHNSTVSFKLNKTTNLTEELSSDKDSQKVFNEIEVQYQNKILEKQIPKATKKKKVKM